MRVKRGAGPLQSYVDGWEQNLDNCGVTVTFIMNEILTPSVLL